MPDLTIEEKGERMLTVLYKMSGGIAGVEIAKVDWFAEVQRAGVPHMTGEEFEQYRAAAVAQTVN